MNKLLKKKYKNMKKDDTIMKEDLIKYVRQMINEGNYDDECMIGDCELISNLLHIINIIDATDEQFITELVPKITDVLETYINVK